MTVVDCQAGDVCLTGSCVEDTLENRYPDCVVPSLEASFGDGSCLTSLNTETCGYDGGDCCATTNPLCPTSSTGCDCQDPGAPEKDPCYQVTCYERPRPSCDQNDVLTYASLGACQEGACHYDVQTRTPCAEEICSTGTCLDPSDPCAGVACTEPPLDTCDGDRALRYAVSGGCAEGSCTYTSISELCAVGCSEAYCIPYPVTLTTTTGPFAGEMSVAIFEGSTLIRAINAFPYNSTQSFELDIGPGDYCAHFTDGMGDQGLTGTILMDDTVIAGWASADYTSDEGCISSFVDCSGSICFTIDQAIISEGPVECTANQFEDCDGACVSVSYQGWQGDGHCDDGAMYLNLNCETFEFDGGDCN